MLEFLASDLLSKIAMNMILIFVAIAIGSLVIVGLYNFINR